MTTDSYGIITAVDNTVTAVISRRHILIIFRMAQRTRQLMTKGSRCKYDDADQLRLPICLGAASYKWYRVLGYSFVGSVVRLEDSTEHVSDWHMKARLRYAPVSPNTHRRSSKLRSARLR